MSRRQKLLSGLVFLHLILVAMGASQRPPLPGRAGVLIDYYGSLSGASSGYGFFAPRVGSQLRGRFDIYDDRGKIGTQSLERGENREADLRVGNILGWFWLDSRNRPLQRSLAASWAGKAFARNPDAVKVGVRLESYYLPIMEKYRAGERPYWKPYYEAKFVRRPPSAGG